MLFNTTVVFKSTATKLILDRISIQRITDLFYYPHTNPYNDIDFVDHKHNLSTHIKSLASTILNAFAL